MVAYSTTKLKVKGSYPGWGQLKQLFTPGVVVFTLLCRQNARNLNGQEERLAPSPLMVTRLHLSHAIVVKLHVSKINVAILAFETAVAVGI